MYIYVLLRVVWFAYHGLYRQRKQIIMLEAITDWFKKHEPSSEEAIVIIRHAIKLLSPTEIAELKMIVAAIDTVDKAADAVVQTDTVVAPMPASAQNSGPSST